MRKLVATFVKYPFYANIIIAIILIGGTFSLLNMKKSFFPDRKTTEIIVNVFYPGASPKEMEEGITTRVEEAIRGIVGIKEVNSTSSENFSSTVITTTGEYDIDETLMEVKNAVDGISSFPVDAEKPIVFKRRATSNAMFVALSGEVDLMTLKKLADEIEYDFLNSGVMSQVRVSGYPALEISVEITEEDLLRYNISFDEIARAIALNNRDVSAGMIRSEKEEILIRSRARSVDPNEIADIIVRANESGSYLRIRDVANVKMKFADVPDASYMNGKRNITLQITKLAEEDLAEITEFVKEYTEKFNRTHNAVQLEITYNFHEMLNARLNLLYRNGGIGLLLVLITLGMFLSVRLSAWVAFGIPASFLAMFILASSYGITINMISLFGMILVIGILVDDGIVIAENIYTHFEKGKSPRQAAVDGTMEVLPAVATSVTTTIIAFSPLLLLEGRMEMMMQMAFVVIFSLFFSLFEAFFVLPAHVGNKWVLRPKDRQGWGRHIRKRLDYFLVLMRDKLYARVLRFLLKWKWVVIITPVAIMIVTYGLVGGGLIKTTFFPTIPFDFFNIDVAFKPGEGEKKTVSYLKEFENAVWEANEELMEKYDDTLSFIDYTYRNVGNAFNGQETGAHAGNIFVQLRDMEGAPIDSYTIANKIQDKIGPVPEAEKFTVGGQNRWGKPVSVSLLGKNLEELNMAKDFMLTELNQFQSLKDVTNTNALGKREIRLEPKPRAWFLGLDRDEIAGQVRQGFFGGQAQRLQVGKDEVRVWVRYPKSDRVSIGQLESMKLKTREGEFPLSELANYYIERGPVNINRYNGYREIRIEADLVDPYEPVPPLIEKIKNDVLPRMQAKYPGVSIAFQGQQKASDEAAEELMKYFVIAFAIIILIIMIHFKSFLQGSIILMMIPLGWIGAVWGHGVEGIPVSMLSVWGMVALSGVIINDAVVFLAKYNSLLLEEKPVIQAAFEAGLARFRAIVLTTITTTVGLYPIILEDSFQAQFLIPMAVSLAYGVLIGTGFILLFFPVLIVVTNDIRLWATYIYRVIFRPDIQNPKPGREEVEPVVKYAKRELE
ncbi:MAG: efflux RND transporter permease subunit [Bacteroidales bacterium]|nr:efflux RND transporter permease subunit [Bacteroidales bacterium]MCF8345156.1 efflux RND transporter permease subunit [Bacteroidales bacterium]MCF8376232.1 efflux RND transporter permease subunit [Bacteroidales bacterium]MCF8401211.1 efflux RND transporter permease subunit [Bacteroidales bacterium]